MLTIRKLILASSCACALLIPTVTTAAVYTLVEGYNVLDTNNAPVFATGAIGTNYAGTAGQERDIAVDGQRGIIYLARGTGGVPDGRTGTAAQLLNISAIVVTNGAREGSNFRDTGLVGPVSGSLQFCQSLAYDAVSDKLWVLGGPLGAAANVYSAPGGTLGGAPNGDGISSINAALTRAFTLDTNLLETGVYQPGLAGPANRGGQPRGFAVRTVGTNTTVYVGMGNHVEAWRNDQPLEGTNSPWRRIWATLRPPATTLTTTRVAANFTGINGLAVDEAGNCYFSVQGTGGRIWTVRPELAESAPDPMSLDYNDMAFGGASEREILPIIINASNGALLTSPPQSLTFALIDNRRTLFVSSLPSASQRGVTRLEIENSFFFTNSGAFIPARAVDGFGSGQPAAGQDSILATMRLKGAVGVTQPYGTTTGLLYTDVDSVTNPTYIYTPAFVVDTNKGQTIPTAAVLKIRIPVDTNPPSVLTQPSSQTLLEGGTIRLQVGASGQKPLFYQWQSNSVDIPGANDSTLSLSPASTNQSGQYRVLITNSLGAATSAVVNVTVNPLVRSTAMTPLWSLAPGSRPYLTTDDTQRGMAYNPDTTHLLLLSRAPSLGIHVLDSSNGDHLFQLGVEGIQGGSPFAANQIGVSADGQIYVANLAQNGTNFNIYRWSIEESGASPGIAYSGNPAPINYRWGDTFDVRGSGNDIQILTSTRSSNVVAIFTTSNGGQTFTPTIITVPEASGASFGLGLAFGAGNTFWAKADGSGPLRQVEFDLATGTGIVVRTYAAANFVSAATPLSVETNLNVLAAISVENPDNLRLYSLANPANPPLLVDQELFATDNPNGNVTGAVDFGGGKVFALDSNNGLIALTLGEIPTTPGAVTLTRNGTSVQITWSGNFTLQSAASVLGPWSDVTTTGNSHTVNTADAPQKYFRLRN
jgi:hypothetical protein